MHRFPTLVVAACLVSAVAVPTASAAVVERDPPTLSIAGTGTTDVLEISKSRRKIEILQDEGPSPVEATGHGCTRTTSDTVRCSPDRIKRMPVRLRAGNDSYYTELDRFSNTIYPVVRGGSGTDFNEGTGPGGKRLHPRGMTAMGGADRDDIHGGPGNDRLLGGDGNDYIKSARLSAHWGDDFLSGGPGNDMLIGGRGDDVLRGGPGHDVCEPRLGHDRVYGCEVVR